MARKRYSRAASSPRGPKNNVWTTVLGDQVDIANLTSNEFNIVQDSDWSAIVGAERCTILRIRGWLKVHNKVTTGIRDESSVFCYVTLMDEDAPVAAADLVQTYTDEDILWTGGGAMTVTDTNATGIVVDMPIDIKAMRKMRRGQELRLVVTNPSATVQVANFVIRALLRKGGN